MAEKLTTYDPAEDLSSDAAIATFMAQAFETEDAGYIAHALGVVARAKGMTQIASETGLSREQLYRSFSENGNPTLKTTIAVMKVLGIELTAKVHA
jgi:probable addiction module antidote protein